VFAAREEAKHLISKARAEIEADRENASEEVKRQIIELSTFMAGRFVELSIDKESQDKYIEEALADWSDQTWQT
jgi:F-type H+-transporting ATPase subunit b